MNTPSPKTLDLILKYEVGGGKAYYEKFLSKPTWPGGASGMTLGIGIDCAYYTPQELKKIFNFLPEDQLYIIVNASGKTGSFQTRHQLRRGSSPIVVAFVGLAQVYRRGPAQTA